MFKKQIKKKRGFAKAQNALKTAIRNYACLLETHILKQMAGFALSLITDFAQPGKVEMEMSADVLKVIRKFEQHLLKFHNAELNYVFFNQKKRVMSELLWHFKQKALEKGLLYLLMSIQKYYPAELSLSDTELQRCLLNTMTRLLREGMEEKTFYTFPLYFQKILKEGMRAYIGLRIKEVRPTEEEILECAEIERKKGHRIILATQRVRAIVRLTFKLRKSLESAILPEPLKSVGIEALEDQLKAAQALYYRVRKEDEPLFFTPTILSAEKLKVK